MSKFIYHFGLTSVELIHVISLLISIDESGIFNVNVHIEMKTV